MYMVVLVLWCAGFLHDAFMQPLRVTNSSCRPFGSIYIYIYNHCWVGMMLECSSGELLTMLASMHHDNKKVYQSDMRPLKGQ